MYKKIMIFPKKLEGRAMYPDSARSLVAAACDGLDIDPGVFCRMPDGKTIQRVFGHTRDGAGFGAVPSVIFGGGNGFISLVGIGVRGSELLTKNGAKIATAISKLHGDCPYRFDVAEGMCKIGGPDGSTFRIRNLIVSKKRELYAQIAANGLPTLEAMEPLIKKAISRGLIGQARALDEEIGSHLTGAIQTDESLDIKIFGGKPVFVPLREGQSTCVLGVHGLLFTMRQGLAGPWYVGHLRSRGYGLIEKGRMS